MIFIITLYNKENRIFFAIIEILKIIFLYLNFKDLNINYIIICNLLFIIF